MPIVALSQTQIDYLADACHIAINEYAQCLEEDVILALAQALHAMGKQSEAVTTHPDYWKLGSNNRR